MTKTLALVSPDTLLAIFNIVTVSIKGHQSFPVACITYPVIASKWSCPDTVRKTGWPKNWVLSLKPTFGLSCSSSVLSLLFTKDSSTGPWLNNYSTVNVLKFQTSKKKNTLNLYSLLTIEAKGSNKFCKGRQFIASLSSQNIWYFPFRN